MNIVCETRVGPLGRALLFDGILHVKPVALFDALSPIPVTEMFGSWRALLAGIRRLRHPIGTPISAT
jgi:hypothetical protein